MFSTRSMPFALKEPGGHADERPVRGQVQAEALQQGRLAGLFPVQVVPVIGCGQEGVPVGVPPVIVHPLQDAVELLGPIPEEPLQPEAILRGQDLFPVFGGHGGEQVRKHQAALHEIELAVKFQGLGREQFPAQAGEGEVVGRKQPLVAHVVDRVDHRQALEAGAVVIEGPEIDGHQAGLPFVGVADVELQFQGVDHLHHGPGKEDEPLGIVVKIPVGGAVETFPVKQGVLADEVKIQVGVDLGGEDLGGQGLPGERNGKGLSGGGEGAARFPYLPVQGQNHRYLVAQLDQGPGQGIDHLGQAAAPGKRVGFRGYHQDTHLSSLEDYSVNSRRYLAASSGGVGLI